MHKIKLSVWCLVLAGFGVLFSGCVGKTPRQKYVRDVEISGAMAAGRTLSATTSNGNIKVAGADEAQCVVKAKITARGWSAEEAQTIGDAVEISLVEKGGTTEVCVKKPESKLSKYIGISFDITVPKESGLALKTSNGNISLRDTVGSVNAGTSNGNISSQDVVGVVNLRTSNGNVTCRGVLEDVKAKSSNGSVVVSYLADAGKAVVVDLETSNGSVRFTGPAGMSAKVEASTSNGSVSTSLPITVVGKMSKTRLKGTIGQGEGCVRLRTSNGSISID